MTIFTGVPAAVIDSAPVIGRRACMSMSGETFVAEVTQILERFAAQNAAAFSPDAAAAVGRNLLDLVIERGLPAPLATGERGQPGGMSAEACEPLIRRVLADAGDGLLREAATQLVKACFYPEFLDCRNSFRETHADGTCRRQELSRVRRRISGTHCVDCPYWTALAPDAHQQFLTDNWCADAADFRAHREIFLPEDFRRLRRWLHAAAREGVTRD